MRHGYQKKGEFMVPELNAAALFQKEKEENIRAMTQDKNTKRIGRLFMDHVTDYKYGYYFNMDGTAHHSASPGYRSLAGSHDGGPA